MARVSRDVGDELARLLCAGIGEMCASVRVEERRSRRWASVTFAGERHRLRLRLEGPGAELAADRFLEGLSEREFPLKGHVLADIAPVLDERGEGGRLVRLGLEALTVEAA